jgi:predicted phage terminase large subunit-like protein
MTTHSEVEAVLRQDFLSFVLKVFLTLHPGQTYLPNWHVEAIVWHLLQVMAGQTQRAMINVPPRTLKSMIVSIAWPAFLLGHNPTRKIFVVSHSLDLAEVLHADFRKIVDSDWYRAVFNTMSPAAEKDTALVFRTSLGGERKAFSVDSSITGQGADYIVLDDPLDASDAPNDLACEKINRWIADVLMGRFNNAADGVMVLVMQRLSINDPAAFLQEIAPWSVLSLPAVSDRDLWVPISQTQDHLFSHGDLLHPDLLTGDYLESRRKAMGAPAYSAQYLQEPLPAGGGAIDVSQFQTYTALPRTWDCRFISVDAATGSQSGSYSVLQFWQISDGRIYLADSKRGRWAFPELKQRAIEGQLAFNADSFFIEYASNGVALVEELWRHYPREVRQRLVQYHSSKVEKTARMNLAMIPIADGKVFLPAEAAWLPAFRSELMAFPNGANDDQVDALSQALWFFSHPYEENLLNPEYRKRSRVISPLPATW